MWRFAALGVHRMSLKALLWTVAYLQYVTLCHMVGSYVLENSALCSCLHLFFYFARGSVCKVLWWLHLSSSVCVSVCEDMSGTTWVVFTKCFMHVAYGRESGSRCKWAVSWCWCCEGLMVDGRKAVLDVTMPSHRTAWPTWTDWRPNSAKRSSQRRSYRRQVDRKMKTSKLTVCALVSTAG